MKPLLLTRSTSGVFCSYFFFLGTARVVRAKCQGPPQRREGLDTGTIPGGRFRRGRNLHGLALAGILAGGMNFLWLSNPPGSDRPATYESPYRGIPHRGYHLLSSFSMGISFSIKALSRNSRDVSRCCPLAGTKG